MYNLSHYSIMCFLLLWFLYFSINTTICSYFRILNETVETIKQIRGHHIAKLDPLDLPKFDLESKNLREVIHNSYRFGKKERQYSTFAAQFTSIYIPHQGAFD